MAKRPCVSGIIRIPVPAPPVQAQVQAVSAVRHPLRDFKTPFIIFPQSLVVKRSPSKRSEDRGGLSRRPPRRRLDRSRVALAKTGPQTLNSASFARLNNEVRRNSADKATAFHRSLLREKALPKNACRPKPLCALCGKTKISVYLCSSVAKPSASSAQSASKNLLAAATCLGEALAKTEVKTKPGSNLKSQTCGEPARPELACGELVEPVERVEPSHMLLL